MLPLAPAVKPLGLAATVLPPVVGEATQVAGTLGIGNMAGAPGPAAGPVSAAASHAYQNVYLGVPEGAHPIAERVFVEAR